MENKEYIDQLLIRYWDKTASRADKEELLQWLKTSDENRRYFNSSFELWTASLSANKVQSDTAFERFKSTINQEEQLSIKRIKLQPYLLRIASICILTLLGYFVVQNTSFWKKEVYVQEVIMPHGNKGKITLPDGSLVWLNSDSKISYPRDFSDAKREVAIEGQAYFEVAKDADRPFVLTADKVSVEVLGTKFDVQNYPAKNEISVTLLEGSISVSDDTNPKGQLLSPDQKYTYSKESRTNKIDKTNATFSNVWIQDKLTFENKKLSDIIPYIENWFGVTVVCDTQLAENTRLTFTIRQDSLDDILQSIEYISTLSFEENNNKVYIKSKQ